MSLLCAKDLSGANIRAKDAKSSHKYLCPFCGAAVFRKLSKNNNPFFACYQGEKHNASVCRYISETKETHSTDGLDPVQFFAGLLRTPQESPNAPKEPTKPDISGSSYSPLGIETDDGVLKNGDSNPEDGVEKPFTSLKQIWLEGLDQLLQPNSPIGNQKADEFIIYKKWFKHCFETVGFTGGDRIIQASPQGLEQDQTVRFSCYWKKNWWDDKWERIYFLLKFQNEDVFFDYVNRMFEKLRINDEGKKAHDPKHKWVLIAGHWDIAPGEPEDNPRRFTCNFVNKRQLYLCPN